MARTLTIIKPDSVADGNAGKIIAHLEGEGFRVIALRRIHLDAAQAGTFYEVHKERPFYRDLVEFMTSGPCIPIVLERDDAVAGLRKVMGATNPKDADEGTIRKLYASNVERNAIHGSDSDENAALEASFFFARADLIG